jgi:hypothetical protein
MALELLRLREKGEGSEQLQQRQVNIATVSYSILNS